MTKVVQSQSFNCSAAEVFAALDHINKLARLKTDLRSYRIARDEEGLQLIDVNVRFFIKRYPLRLKYTAVPNKYCELKMLKGALKHYEYRYTVMGDNASATVTVECSIKLPFRYFIVAPLLRAILNGRIKKELSLLKKILHTSL
ncbi:MAG: SRPBCC family protein [Spirochaetota bacterium]